MSVYILLGFGILLLAGAFIGISEWLEDTSNDPVLDDDTAENPLDRATRAASPAGPDITLCYLDDGSVEVELEEDDPGHLAVIRYESFDPTNPDQRIDPQIRLYHVPEGVTLPIDPPDATGSADAADGEDMIDDGDQDAALKTDMHDDTDPEDDLFGGDLSDHDALEDLEQSLGLHLIQVWPLDTLDASVTEPVHDLSSWPQFTSDAEITYYHIIADAEADPVLSIAFDDMSDGPNDPSDRTSLGARAPETAAHLPSDASQT